MMHKKSELVATTKIIILTLIIVAIFAAIFFLYKVGVPDKIRNVFPDYFPKNESAGQIENSLICPEKVAFIIQNSGRNYIKFCNDNDCKNQRDSGLYIKDNLVYSSNNYQIGQIGHGSLIILSEVMEGRGSERFPDLYFNVRSVLPSYTDLLNLQFSYFYGGADLCKDGRTTEEEFRKAKATKQITLPKNFISSGVLYYNVDELIKNKGKSNTKLFKDKNLVNVANSFIGSDWNLEMRDEEGNNFPAGTMTTFNTLIPLSPQDINFYSGRSPNEGETPLVFTLKSPLDNRFNHLGFDNGEQFDKILFIKRNNLVYVAFRASHWYKSDSDTFFFRLDYWNSYQDGARIPQWAMQ